jgi:hypothetical protein
MINLYPYYITIKNFISYVIYGRKPDLRELEFVMIKKINNDSIV